MEEGDEVEIHWANGYNRPAGRSISSRRRTSASILNDREPEADGEEGLLDMIVLAAVKRSLETGETVKLQPRDRGRHVQPDQALKLKPAKQPGKDELISVIPQSA